MNKEDIRGQINKFKLFLNEKRGNKEASILDNSEIIKIIDGIKIRVIDHKRVSKLYPVWNEYLGSHHWGKESLHIPKDEIWISDKVLERDLDIVIEHEIIERAIMRGLQKYKKMTPSESWEIAHYFTRDIGF